jgi:hypothetical protein
MKTRPLDKLNERESVEDLEICLSNVERGIFALELDIVNEERNQPYLEQMYKISLTYLKGGTLLLFIDDEEIARKKVSLGTVRLHPSDCQIGRGASNAEQFYGELFEICMHTSKGPSEGLTSLAPSYTNILFYYAFGV